MGDCSTNCNPCGPSYDAINQLAVQTKSYARQALSAVTTVEEFQSLYLGAKATAPTTDNEGNPLQVGALYFNTTDGEMYVWAGSAWEFFGQSGFYLGPKASDPTTDNEGNPLVAGLLYFNTTSNVMRVYNGIFWQNVSFDESTPFLATGTTTPRNLVTRMADVVNVLDFIPEAEHAAIKAGTSTYDATADIQAAIDSVNEYTEINFSGLNLYVTNELIIKRHGTIIRGGNFIFDKNWVTPNNDAFVTPALFTTERININSSLNDIKFINVNAAATTGAGKAGPDSFLFQSLSTVEASPGAYSLYVYGRCDYFKMINCNTSNMKLCGTYGIDTIIQNNIAKNNYAFQQERDRNIAITINQIISDAPDVSNLDTKPSNATITNNKLFYFGGGITLHTYFNNTYDDRRVMSGIVSQNIVIGRTKSEENSNPNYKFAQFCVYFASVKDIICSNNIMQNGIDMVVDFEFCDKFTLSDNLIKNGGVKFFWKDCNNAIISNNRFETTDADYPVQFLTTATSAVLNNYFITNNKFINNIPNLVDALFSINTGINNITINGNIFEDVICRFTGNGEAIGVNLCNNKFIATIDRSLIEPLITLYNNSHLVFDNNEITTSAIQASGSKALVINNDRYTVGSTTYDGKTIDIKNNKILNFPISIHIIPTGTAFANWIAKIIENEYDGEFINGITRTDNRVFLFNNYKYDSSYKMQPADPALPPTTGNYAKGSRIPIFQSLTGTTSEVFCYVCIGETMGTGGTWKAQTANYI